jgi:hypothetical protein
MVFSRYRTQTRFVILPPSRLAVTSSFRNVETNNRRHDELFAEMQRFRGSVYSADGAIQADQLTADGRHKMAIDEESWHILSLDNGRVVSCLRFLDETTASGFDDLWIRHAALANCPSLGRRFRRAVEEGMERARHSRMGFCEVGGWAVAESHRRTLEPVRLIVAACGLAELLGGCTGVATATFRHNSAMILRRIGLHPLRSNGQELPPYYDPHYRCQMQVLQFDSRRPNPKYSDWFDEITGQLATTPVIARESFVSSLQGFVRGFEIPSEPALAPAAF